MASNQTVTGEEKIEAALTAWDRQCIADIEAGTAKIEEAIARAPNQNAIRPLIGDARPMPLAYWQAEIVTRRGWIADIKRDAVASREKADEDEHRALERAERTPYGATES